MHSLTWPCRWWAQDGESLSGLLIPSGLTCSYSPQRLAALGLATAQPAGEAVIAEGVPEGFRSSRPRHRRCGSQTTLGATPAYCGASSGPLTKRLTRSSSSIAQHTAGILGSTFTLSISISTVRHQLARQSTHMPIDFDLCDRYLQ